DPDRYARGQRRRHREVHGLLGPTGARQPRGLQHPGQLPAPALRRQRPAQEPPMSGTTPVRRQSIHDERGVALLIAVVLLLMVSALGLMALQSAQDEATGSARGRRKTMALYAADSGLKLVEQQLAASSTQYPNRNAITSSSVMQDQWGASTSIRTGEAEN